MAATIKMAPWTYDFIMNKLGKSAAAAALQCSGGNNGRLCGLKWIDNSTWDGTYGVGQQMSALEVIQSNLITQVKGPLTNTTGGTSEGNPNAGANSATAQSINTGTLPTMSDKVGAGFVTLFVLVGLIGGAWWIFL